MFYILIILGTIFIVLGILSEKRTNIISKDILTNETYNTKEIEADYMSYKEEVEGLGKRIQAIEEILFANILEEEISNPMNITETFVERDALGKYKLIQEYEKQRKSLDEIAKLLDMNKGEVLLLKNLYKNS